MLSFRMSCLLPYLGCSSCIEWVDCLTRRVVGCRCCFVPCGVSVRCGLGMPLQFRLALTLCLAVILRFVLSRATLHCYRTRSEHLSCTYLVGSATHSPRGSASWRSASRTFASST